MDKLAELAGFGLILGFLWFVWPPLVLLGAGLLLVAYANTRTHSGRIGLATGAAWAAARRAYAASRDLEAADTAPLRRVA